MTSTDSDTRNVLNGNNTDTSSSSQSSHNHKYVVLFYKYFLNESDTIMNSPSTIQVLEQTKEFICSVCTALEMKGRILLSQEGINGSLSASNKEIMACYIQKMKDYHIGRGANFTDTPAHTAHVAATNIPIDLCVDPGGDSENSSMNSIDCKTFSTSTRTSALQVQNKIPLFQDIDWKISTVNEDSINTQNTTTAYDPFPDLKISIVKEIVSTGNSNISIKDIEEYGGNHLSPEEFHEILQEHWGNSNDANCFKMEKTKLKKELVVIDVRNTFEYAIGHFLNPNKINSDETTNQLKINTDGENSHYKIHTDEDNAIINSCTNTNVAMNPEMVTFSSFDGFGAKHESFLKSKQVLLYCTGGIRCEKASAMLRKRGIDDVKQLSGGIHRYMEKYPNGFYKGKNFVFDQRVAIKPKESCSGEAQHRWVVGRCIECKDAFDEISGSRLCTVCRDLVLVCPSCQNNLREYHCNKHAKWKNCYYTFLEIFDESELNGQLKELVSLHDKLVSQKNPRKTLTKQMNKVKSRIEALQRKEAHIYRNAPRRCRTCRQPSMKCDGLCWGFWRTSNVTQEKATKTRSSSTKLPLEIGAAVEPGPDWNEFRLGKKTLFKRGQVVEIKSWSSGGEKDDCVLVEWGIHGESKNYRWGSIDRAGERNYDVQLVER